MNKRLSIISLITFLVFFLVQFLIPNFLLPLELKVFDSYTRLLRSTGYFFPKLSYSAHLDDVVVVNIDETTVKKLRKKFPLPRYFFADLVNKLYETNPKIVIFDMVFSGESENKEEDVLLAKALKGKTNILLPYASDDAGRPLYTDKLFLTDLASAGYINKPIDSDITIRRVRPFDLTIENKIRDCSAEFHLFSKYYDYDLKSIVLDKKQVWLKDLKPKKGDLLVKDRFYLNSNNTIWIKYQADQSRIHKIPLWQVLSDDFDASVFEGKIVLVGVTAKILHDIHNTPFGLMSGVEIMANVATMFLDGKFIDEAPLWLSWLWVFVLCLLTVLTCYRLQMFKGFLLSVSLGIIIVAATFFLFLNNYYFSPFRLVVIVIVSYIVINFYKYTSVVMENLSLRKISSTDELTGLHTFRFFQVVMEHEFQKSLRYKTPLSLLMLDIDDFKKINDTYGHQNGNVVLKKIGKLILNNLRKSDFPVRYGGEELVALLPHTNLEGACKCADNIRRLIEKEGFFMTREGPKKVTVSIGISSFPDMKANSAEDMVRFSDVALYKAKQEGKNRVIIYSEEASGSIKTA
jgi:diguanylate cyclase (GGDEF)-like protein